MTQVKKYAGAYNNVGNFTVPERILGVEDSLCAFKQLVGVDHATIYVSQFGFAIPADAIIDSVYCNAKGVVDEIAGHFQTSAGFSFTKSPYSTGGAWVTYSNMGNCSMTAYDGQDALFGGSLTPADLNNETFIAECDFETDSSGSIAQCFIDSYYIIVNYHQPPVAQADSGDGLVFITETAKNLRKTYKSRFPPLTIRRL